MRRDKLRKRDVGGYDERGRREKMRKEVKGK
jgi:hypothetical protein